MTRVSIEQALLRGNPRSLGRTEEVVQWVLAEPALLEALFECVLHTDEIVRMRASDALEKVARQQPAWLVPYVERLLIEVAALEQA